MAVEEDVGGLSLWVAAAAVCLAKPSQHTGTTVEGGDGD